MDSTAATAGDDAQSERVPRPASRPSLRTGLLSAALVGASFTLFRVLHLQAGAIDGVRLQWWTIALISIAAELMVFNLEFRREVYTFTFGEIPLVLGLFLASPGHLVVGRLVGAAAFLIVKERQPVRKWTLNLSSFYAECAVLLTVSHMLGNDHPSISRPTSWLLALAAVAAADLLGYVVVAAAVRWHGGRLRMRSILAIGALTAPVNTSFALVTVLVVTNQPWATLLLGGIAAFLVLSYRSYTALSQRFDSLSQLYDFTRLVGGSQRPDEVVEGILGQAKDVLRAERAEIWLADESGEHLGIVVDDSGRSNRELPADAGQLVAQWFDANDHRAQIATSTSSDPTSRAIVAALAAVDCIVAPIVAGGEVVGLIAVVDRLGETKGFGAADGPVFATLANHASVALENGRLIVRLHDQAHQLEHDAQHDALTALPNRVLFGDRLREQTGDDAARPVGVAVMDLDGFKEINDTLGHQAGDRVLIEVAHRILSVVDVSILVARLGGDEFALLFPDAVDRTQVELVTRQVRAAVAAPMQVEGVRVNMGISAGIAVSPDDGTDAATLLSRADVAMYEAKAGFGDGVSFYNADSDVNTPRRLTLANDLAAAITNGEVTVAFQPKVRLADGVVTGFEALARWRHPVFGPIGPDEFIPLAERTGMIQPLAEHVLRVALEQTRAWADSGAARHIAINLSMRNLLDPGLVALVRGLLRSSGVDVSLVTLEITESNVMSDPDRTIAVLTELATIGVHLSVDDFGTGYSSLSYLQRLPVSEVKIDKSFVLSMSTDPGSDAIVRSILDLARNMNLQVVAEGVEDRETWMRLRNLGCQEAQGFYMARPLAAVDVPAAIGAIAAMQLGDDESGRHLVAAG